MQWWSKCSAVSYTVCVRHCIVYALYLLRMHIIYEIRASWFESESL